MNDVSVFRVSWGDDPWRIQCAYCECWVRGYRHWETAYVAATAHADEHERNRCKECGRTS